jgi:hypothetical protein
MSTKRRNRGRGAGTLIRDRLGRRADTRQWAHHVADLNSGRVLSTVMREPLTAKSRVEGLSRLGPAFEAILGGALYRLTPRTPYQASPEAWLSGFGIDYLNLRIPDIQWTPEGAPSTPGDMKGLFFYFSQLPQEWSLLTISLRASPWSARWVTCPWGTFRSVRSSTHPPVRFGSRSELANSKRWTCSSIRGAWILHRSL